jgi:tetratricopeptide (TPR) repeat protein
MKTQSNLLDQILIHGPSQNTVFLILNEMHKEGRTREVIQGCLHALSTCQNDIRLRKLLAESYLKAGFIGLAETELDKVASELHTLSSVYMLQSQIYATGKRYGQALEALRKYLILNPEDPEGLEFLARITPPEGHEDQPILEEPSETPLTQSSPERVEKELEAEPDMIDQPRFEQPKIEQLTIDQIDESLDTQAPPPEIWVQPPEPALDSETEKTPEEEAIVDLATPTIAELYLKQGRISEAISIYEKIVLTNPMDTDSQQRLAQLKSGLSEEPIPEEKDLTPDPVRVRTEKTIAILEKWLTGIRMIANG